MTIETSNHKVARDIVLPTTEYERVSFNKDENVARY
jgi:hypothetical protein